jgi:hypothetical protein
VWTASAVDSGAIALSENGSVMVWTVSTKAGAADPAVAGAVRHAIAPPRAISRENGSRNFSDAASQTACRIRA